MAPDAHEPSGHPDEESQAIAPGDSGETEGTKNPGRAKAYAELAKPEIDLLKEHHQKQEERRREKAEVEERLQEALAAGDASAADQARDEVQSLEELLLISEGKVSYGEEPPPSPPSL